MLGFARGIIMTASNTIIAYNFPDKISKLIPAMLIALNLGTIVGRIYGVIVEKWLGYTWVFLIIAAVLLLTLILT